MTDDFESLLAKVRALPPMTERQLEENHFDFTYGNLACTTNHKPSLAAFAKLAKERGWTQAQFVAWAADRRWWPR